MSCFSFNEAQRLQAVVAFAMTQEIELAGTGFEPAHQCLREWARKCNNELGAYFVERKPVKAIMACVAFYEGIFEVYCGYKFPGNSATRKSRAFIGGFNRATLEKRTLQTTEQWLEMRHGL